MSSGRLMLGLYISSNHLNIKRGMLKENKGDEDVEENI